MQAKISDNTRRVHDDCKSISSSSAKLAAIKPNTKRRLKIGARVARLETLRKLAQSPRHAAARARCFIENGHSLIVEQRQQSFARAVSFQQIRACRLTGEIIAHRFLAQSTTGP